MATWLAYCRKSRINPHDRKAVESRTGARRWDVAGGDRVEFFELDNKQSGGSTEQRTE